MITDYFTHKQNPLITEYYELHRQFISRNKFATVYREIHTGIVANASRKSCVCMDARLMETFTIYSLPRIPWTETLGEIKDKILGEHCQEQKIDYGLVHYYHDENATISWHSDKEAMTSNIYSVSIGGTRRFCLRDVVSGELLTFDLFDGDLFIMKVGCQEKYEHCIKSIKMYGKPRISITFRQVG